MAGLLDGVKVVESAMLITGTFTGQLLADEGADVIKLESPFKGDYLRHFQGQVKPHTEGHSPIFISLNRNKRSVTCNLRTSEGKEIFWKLLKDTDVFLDGNAGDAIDKLGVGYEAQKRVKPDIVYAHITGLGATGPYAALPTHGGSMNALAGASPCVMNAQGLAVRAENGGLDAVGHKATGADIVGPMFLAYAVAGALFRRERTGQGALIEVGCSDALIASCWYGLVHGLNEDKIWQDQAGRDESGASRATGSAKYNNYQTKDAKYVLIALIEKHFWEHFCEAIDRPDLLEESVGYVKKDAVVDWGPDSLRPELQRIFHTKTLEEWMEIAVKHDCVIAPATSPQDLLTDPHLVYREAVVTQHHPTAGDLIVTGNPIKVEGQHYEIRRHAPALGEHTFDVLSDLGYGREEVERWKTQGIV